MKRILVVLIMSLIAISILSSTVVAESGTIRYVEKSNNFVMFNFIPPTTDKVNYIKWNFGDGVGSNELNPSHKYDLDGKYTVSVYVKYQSGIESNLEILVKIGNVVEETPLDVVSDTVTQYNLIILSVCVILAIGGILVLKYIVKTMVGSSMWYIGVLWVLAIACILLFSVKMGNWGYK